MKRIKFIINSKLENVALAGMSIKSLCSLSPMDDSQAFQMELCAVEAINNSIIHAYNKEVSNDVEIILEIDEKYFRIEICDRGIPMDQKILEKADINLLQDTFDNPEEISESGRGLAVIKDVMDRVTYESVNGLNILTMIKYT